VKQNRRSIKIDFVQEETVRRGASTISSATGFAGQTDVQTDFEKEFRQAIEESGMKWNETKSNDFPASAPIQEDRERRQMARVRTILRAEQIRARRLKKIKSKTYRKLLRKKELKGMADMISRLDKEDPDAAEQVKAELEKKLSGLRLNRQRQARLKWSKAAERFGGKEMRSEISKQAQAEADEKRELLRAIKGQDDENSDESDSDSDSYSSDESDIVAQVKKSLTKNVITDTVEKPHSGLLGMQFMRDAAERQRNQTVAEAEEFIETLENSDAESEPGDDALNAGEGEKEAGDQEALVASLFGAPEHQVVKEKKKSSPYKLETAPAESVDALPGWGSWIGEGVKQRRPKRKQEKEVKKKISNSALLHIASEDTLRAPLMKYQVKEIPYPYSSREEYEMANSTPIGPEWLPLTAHTESIQPKVSARIGAVLPPLKLAKHLDSDKRAKLIDAWDNRKRPRHTKARFL
jgi:U3 small nucleolar RNA-associated protein 14